MYAAGARKHEVWIAGRARVLASGVCVKRQSGYRDVRARKATAAHLDFCRNNYAEYLRYASSHWYTAHCLLTPHLTIVLMSFSSALVLWRMSNVGSQLDLRHPCISTSVLICGQTLADKVEACSDTVPLGLTILDRGPEIGAGFTVSAYA